MGDDEQIDSRESIYHSELSHSIHYHLKESFSESSSERVSLIDVQRTV